MSTSLANEMVQRGHTCHIISLDPENARMHYDLHSAIKWHKISNISAKQKASWAERFSRFSTIRKILKTNKIDVAIGFQDGAFLSLATAALGTHIPVIAAERNSPSRFDFVKEGKFKNLRFNSFRLAQTITVQCSSYIKKYPQYLQRKIKVIPNPVFPADKASEPAGPNKKAKNILSVGRLSFQKNYHVLIEAFSRLERDFPDWNLIIVGDGEEYKKIKTQINRLHLDKKIKLIGYKKNPEKYYSESHLFCLPSRWEGFPNALAEAMAHGLPCVGFQDCSGVSDLINHEKTGLLAEGNDNSKSLEKSLRRLMERPDSRIQIGENAKDSMSRYNPNKIYDMWENFLKQTKEKN